ncbi:MAG: type II/IV secretion system protein [Candidatus Hydrogenedentota bacterium]|nr:MAG: type II/IV secretion system protein [Candidatus Hydrogenedentota bacterium]
MIDVEQPETFIEALRTYQLVDEEQIIQAKRENAITGESLRQIFQRITGCHDYDILNALAYYFGMETVALGEAEIPPDVITLVDHEFATEKRVVPVWKEGRVLRVALDNPLNLRAVDELRAMTGLDVEAMLATPDDITGALERYYGAGLTEDLESIDLGETLEGLGEELEAEEGQELGAEDAPIIKLVNQVIYTAIKERASDIHVECRERRMVIRYRIDGVLHDRLTPPKRLQGAIISRLKLMANCDISERRIPQDGRIKMKVPTGVGKQTKNIDLRFSTLPSLYGESIVMRILDKSGVMLGLEQVGFLPETIAKFEELIAKPNGIILVTGPTGSGKTTTLYAALNKLNTPDRKLITVEDPVEYQLDGINQVQIRADIGLDFAHGLRSLLRQAPDVILVGEIRDLETAEIAIRAALTGHLVFSTLHTNDAPGAVTRLIDMGINPFLVASSVNAIMAQRLVRRICEKCKVEEKPDPAVMEEFNMTEKDVEENTFYRGQGCADCNMTGYAGRTTIFELMTVDEEMKDLILANASSGEIRRLARRKGMHTLREYGLLKIKLGMTTFSEVMRVTPSELSTKMEKE